MNASGMRNARFRNRDWHSIKCALNILRETGGKEQCDQRDRKKGTERSHPESPWDCFLSSKTATKVQRLAHNESIPKDAGAAEIPNRGGFQGVWTASPGLDSRSSGNERLVGSLRASIFQIPERALPHQFV